MGQPAEDDEFRISLAGAQEKSALLWHAGQWQLPHGATPTTLIVNGVPIDNPYYYYTTYYYASYYHRPIKQDETATLRKAGGPKKVPALPPGMQMPDRAQQPGPMQSLPTTPPEDAPGSGPESGR
jgi:hypothetical protein